MKKVFVAAVLSLVSLSAFAGKMTPMHAVEKSSYQLGGLVNKGKVDASFLTDVTSLTIASDSSGFKVTMYSPSSDNNKPNTLDLSFDTSGKVTSFNANFVSRSPQGPIFTKATVATLLDLGAEAIVDHLGESADNVTVAQNAKAIDLSKVGDEILLEISLTNGQVFNIRMDQDGKVLSQGF